MLLFWVGLRVGCALAEDEEPLNAAHLLTQWSAGHVSESTKSPSFLRETLLPTSPTSMVHGVLQRSPRWSDYLSSRVSIPFWVFTLHSQGLGVQAGGLQPIPLLAACYKQWACEFGSQQGTLLPLRPKLTGQAEQC